MVWPPISMIFDAVVSFRRGNRPLLCCLSCLALFFPLLVFLDRSRDLVEKLCCDPRQSLRFMIGILCVMNGISLAKKW